MDSSGSNSSASATMISRKQEKKEFANLNNRLACYISKVRTLENDNQRLNAEVQNSHKSIEREVVNVKSLYEKELSDVRKVLDEISRENAKLELDSRRLFEENIEIKDKFSKKVIEVNEIQHSLNQNELKIKKIVPNYQQLQIDSYKLVEEKKALEKEIRVLSDQLGDMRASIKDETMSRVELENSVQSLKEEFAFKEQIYEHQLNETQANRSLSTSEIDQQFAVQYEEKLYERLQDIRHEYEIDLEANQTEIRKMYEGRIHHLESQLARNSNSASVAISEMKLTNARMKELDDKIAQLEKENVDSKQHARTLEKELDNMKSKYLEEISKYEKDLNTLRGEMAKHIQSYQDLMDVKVALDLEILTYRNLLEGEEQRLHITPNENAHCFKRRKKEIIKEQSDTSDLKSNIELIVCSEGNFVLLKNVGPANIELVGFLLVQIRDDECVKYKFIYETLKCFKQNTTVAVWSSDSTISHSPPKTILMKHQRWLTGEEVTTKLVNGEGKEIKVVKSSQSLIETTRDFLLDYSTKEVTPENCSVM